MKTLLASIVVLLIAVNTAAQTTRAGAIAEAQAEKAKGLGTEGPSEGERIIRQVLLSPLLSGGDGLYPWFGSIYSGTGMGAGVGYLKRLEKDANFNIQTGISLNNSMMARGTVASPELWRGRLQLDASAQWMDVRGVSFYGYGQDSSLANRERFDYTPLELGANLTLRPVRFVSMTASYTAIEFDTHRDTPRFSAIEAPGLDQDLAYDIIRGTMMFDWRPAPGYSTRGGFYRAAFERSKEAAGLPFSFSAQEYEVVQQLPLVREQFVLAGRALMTLTQPDTGHDVPVIMLPYLGSGSALRGFANRRFTDRNRVLLSGEYRWRPSRYIDMALFMDAGQVARERRDFDVSRFDVAWGIGARFHGPHFTALRVEAARGREGIRLIFAGSQPF
ncbi:MAG TPA: BamA/TamA family outer membrane protein [Vicinamibacterales bacterium]